jgi:hypothetical protein
MPSAAQMPPSQGANPKEEGSVIDAGTAIGEIVTMPTSFSPQIAYRYSNMQTNA